jgi:hypothetical protein
MKNLKSLYLKRIQELGIKPNFFCSKSYFDNPEIIGKIEDEWIWVEENELVLFPPISLKNIWNFKNCPITGWWADFANYPLELWDDSHKDWKVSPLDKEFIYSPMDFNNLSGSKWRMFKKNIKRWPDINIGYTYNEKANYFDIKDLLVEWLELRAESVQDFETIIRLILEPSKIDYCKYLYNKDGKLVAINYADENYMYINYRYLICKKEPYLDEFARYCFYTDYDIQKKNKLVNDGGCLDSDNLKRFKMKLNPCSIRDVYSFKKI